MGLRRKCAGRFSLLSVQQKRAAWDWVCRSSNEQCSITTVALTSIPARAELPLALRCPRLRTAASSGGRRAVRAQYLGHDGVSLDSLSDLPSPFSRLCHYVRLNSARPTLY